MKTKTLRKIAPPNDDFCLIWTAVPHEEGTRRRLTPTVCTGLIQEIAFNQPRRHVLLRHVADVLADERFDLELEPVLQHRLELFLPCLLIYKPRILCDLARAFNVLIVQFDLHTGTELASLVINAAQTEKTGGWNGHSPRFIGEIDGALFEDAVDVVPPRIVIKQTIHRQLQLTMQPMQHAADAARRLSTSVGQNAIVLLPKFVFVEAAPDGVLFDVQYEFGRVLFELHDFRLDNRWDAVAAGAHSRAIDLIAAVHQCDGADHCTRVFGVEMKFFTHGVKRHLNVFDDGIALALRVERFFTRSFNRVLQ